MTREEEIEQWPQGKNPFKNTPCCVELASGQDDCQFCSGSLGAVLWLIKSDDDSRRAEVVICENCFGTAQRKRSQVVLRERRNMRIQLAEG